MMRKLQLISIILLSWVITLSVAAQDPQAMLKQITEQTLAALNANKATLKTDPKVVNHIIRDILMPHVEITGMSRSVVGRQYWDEASSAQQKTFETEFADLVAGTYTAALQAYTNQTVKFLPLRTSIKPDQKRVEVKSLVLQPNGPSIPVNYRLILKDNEWKVYDLVVDGVSLLQSYRSQFQPVLQKGGMTALLADMKAHNARSS